MAKCNVLALVLLALCTAAAVATADTQCYVCSSYMEQCKERVHVNRDYVHKTKCKSSCFVRRGDDDALYRGCFDGYLEVEDLKSLSKYTGCRNQTWNNRALPWCLCKGNLCNAESMYTLGHNSGYERNAVDNGGYAKQGGYDDAHNDIVDPYAQPAQYYPTQASYDEAPFEPAKSYGEKKDHTPVHEINHADPYSYGTDQSGGPHFKLDDFVEHNKVSDAPEPVEQEQEEEYDPYRQPRNPEPHAESDDNVYQYPPFRNQPPYGTPNEFYREAPVQEQQHGNDYNHVQEDYPPPPKEYYEEENFVDQVEKEVVDEQPEAKTKSAFPQHLAARIQCAKTGFYQNPDDCRTFVACILDPHYRMPYMHLMRCPEGLVWDNKEKICMEYSSTCNIGGASAIGHQQRPGPNYDVYGQPPPVDHQPYDDTAAERREPIVDEAFAAIEHEQPQPQAYSPPQDRTAYYVEEGDLPVVDEHVGGGVDEEEEPPVEVVGDVYYEPIDASYQPK